MKNNIALLVVDIQKDATELKNSLFKNTENFIKNVNELIEKFEENGEHIFYITHELENIFNIYTKKSIIPILKSEINF